MSTTIPYKTFVCFFFIVVVFFFSVSLAEDHPSQEGTPISPTNQSTESKFFPTRAEEERGSSSVGSQGRYDLFVEVQPRKANGKKWDALGEKPEILIEVTTGIGTISNFSRDSKIKTDCHETYSCVFKGVPLTDEQFKIKIVDHDRLRDDAIGTGFCRVHATCQIGLAKVTVKPSR